MPKVREDADIYENNGISCVRNSVPTSEGEKKELLFWSTDPVESPEGDFLDNVVHKASFITSFNELMSRLELSGEEKVLEMGGGQCWASALLKREHPGCYAVASDLSPDAVYSSRKFEDALGVRIDEKWSFNSRKIPFQNDQFDRVFTFAAFHHFGENGDFSESLAEMVRVLKPRGKAVLLYEPASPGWAYRLYHKRLNREYDYYSRIVDEDSLVPSYMQAMGERLGCRVDVEHFPSYRERVTLPTMLYHYTLTRLKFLRSMLPCPVNVIIEKPG